MSKQKYTIEIPSDTTEAEEYCEYLNKQGHTATVGNTTGTYIDGIWIQHDVKASEISNALWTEYCNAEGALRSLNFFKVVIKMPKTTKRGDKLHCLRCGGDWYQAGENPPQTCRWCNSPDWDKPRTKAATVQRIPRVMENSNSEDYFQGVRVLFVDGMYIGKYGSILEPEQPDIEATCATVVIDYRGIVPEYPIEYMKIVQAVDK